MYKNISDVFIQFAVGHFYPKHMAIFILCIFQTM